MRKSFLILALVMFFVSFTLLGFAKAPKDMATILNYLYDECEWVDLTHSFSTETPVWEGFGQMTAKSPTQGDNIWDCEHTDGFFRATLYTHVGQYGTHVDPPCHFCNHEMTMDQMPLKWMILPLRVIDITSDIEAGEPNHQCTIEDIKEHEAKYGMIPEGSFVALSTNMYKDWDLDKGIKNFKQFKRYPFPAWSMEAIKFLFNERKIIANGHEAMDTDTLGCSVEGWLLDEGYYQIEVMKNLDKVPNTGALIVVTWPKVYKGDGFPARAFAIFPKGLK